MKIHWMVIAATGLLGLGGAALARGNSAATQNPSAPAEVGALVVELSKTVDAKNAKVGDEVSAKLTQDVKADNKVVLHRGAKIIGHVTVVQPHTKEHPESTLGIVFEKATGKNEEVALHATVQAVAAPPEPVISSGMKSDTGVPTSMGSRGNTGTPAGGTMPSTTTISGGSGDGVRGGGGNGGGGALPPGGLTAASKGVFGIPDTNLAAPADNMQAAVITSSSRNVKLESGTQMILQSGQPAH